MYHNNFFKLSLVYSTARLGFYTKFFEKEDTYSMRFFISSITIATNSFWSPLLLCEDIYNLERYLRFKEKNNSIFYFF